MKPNENTFSNESTFRNPARDCFAAEEVSRLRWKHSLIKQLPEVSML